MLVSRWSKVLRRVDTSKPGGSNTPIVNSSPLLALVSITILNFFSSDSRKIETTFKVYWEPKSSCHWLNPYSRYLILTEIILCTEWTRENPPKMRWKILTRTDNKLLIINLLYFLLKLSCGCIGVYTEEARKIKVKSVNWIVFSCKGGGGG